MRPSNPRRGPRGWALRLPAAALVVAAGVLGPGTSGGAQTSDARPTFSGSSSAVGVRVQLTIPGAPLEDNLIDGGGPTAQVAVDSLGSSNGYAAFPDPGSLVVSLPGLIPGFVPTGAGGLPPVKLPTLPPYPFYVESNRGGSPDATLGSGPYALAAHSAPSSAKASASAGYAGDGVGNVALVTSSASLSLQADTVVSTATSEIDAVSIGPLTLGRVRATATETLHADGTVTQTSKLDIAGVKIAGLPVSITSDGLYLLGTSIPLPINGALEQILRGAAISIKVLRAQSFPNRVVAPALVITMPFSVPYYLPQLGRISGTMVVTFGSATASLSSAAQGGVGGVGGVGLPEVSPLTSDGHVTRGLPAIGADSFAPGPARSSITPAAAPPSSAETPVPISFIGLFSIRSVYLLVLLGALAAWVLGQFVRIQGVRSWISGDG